MIRGRIALWADSPIETQVIRSFLSAADYQVVNYFSLLDHTKQDPGHFDAGVIVLERWRTDLQRVRRAMRDRIRSDLPIVAVVESPPSEKDVSSQLLLRPIRLFELTAATERAIHSGHKPRRERAQSEMIRGS